jgi:hypothetical protein
MPLEEMAARGALGSLLWARTTSTERAHAFLRAVHPGAKVALYGHDVARGGHCAPQMSRNEACDRCTRMPHRSTERVE